MIEKGNKTISLQKYRKRTVSRLIAIQSLYQYNFFGGAKSLSAIKDEIVSSYCLHESEEVEDYKDKIDIELLNRLLLLIESSTNNVNEDITPLLKHGWTIDRLSDVMKEIIQVGAIEIRFITDTPFKVVVDEYTTIGSSFFDARKVTFINAVLENIAKKHRASEFDLVKKQRMQKNT